MNLKKLRTKAGLLQSDIAKALGVDRSTVAKWETGIGMPRASQLPKLAKTLGCSISELFGEKISKPKKVS